MVNYIIIKCEMCGTEIEKKWKRKYCNACRKIRDDQLQKEKDAREKEKRLAKIFNS